MIRIALGLILLFSIEAHALECLKAVSSATVPSRVGVQTVHNWSAPITLLIPMPLSPQGKVLDMNALDSSQMPETFRISEGTLRSAFMLVDARQGSPLSACLDELVEDVRARAKTKETQLQLLKTFIAEHLDEVKAGDVFAWDPKVVPPLPPEFPKAAPLTPGHAPLMTKLLQPTVRLEAYLQDGRGLCLQKALLTSLILKRLGIKHRVRAGSSQFAGHTWIELTDGRHLDPTWQLLETTTTEGAWPGWFRFSRSFLYRNDHFPITVD